MAHHFTQMYQFGGVETINAILSTTVEQRSIMREHVIYYFSGTGNSLKTAITVQKALGSCDVVSMGIKPDAIGSVSSIGFVFPCYFGGLPHRVAKCVEQMDFSGQESTYIYAIATYGAIAGTALGQLEKLLSNRGVTLNYAAPLKAFANYVVLYDMSENSSEKLAQTKADLQPIIADILEQKKMNVKGPSPVVNIYNRITSSGVETRDSNFIVHDTCNQCGICEKVCSVQNITLEEGKPHWLGHCEQCLACIHWCPMKAIDYGKKTQNRGRYTNPEITSKMFIDHLEGSENSLKES